MIICNLNSKFFILFKKINTLIIFINIIYIHIFYYKKKISKKFEEFIIIFVNLFIYLNFKSKLIILIIKFDFVLKLE